MAGGLVVAAAAGLPALVVHVSRSAGPDLAAESMLAVVLGLHALVGAVGGLATWTIGRPTGPRLVGPSGGAFLAASLLGALVTGLGASGMSQLPLSAVFATLSRGATTWALGGEGAARRALYVSAATCFVHVLVLLNVELLGAWRIALDELALIQSGLVANLVAGLVGGTAAALLVLDGTLGARPGPARGMVVRR